MVDSPGRTKPRFPPHFEAIARIAIEHSIASHTKGRSKASTKAFASLSSGGCILFHEVCRATFGIDTVIVLPFSPHRFLNTSVEPAGGDWSDRFHKLWQETPHAQRYDLGLSDNGDAYAIYIKQIFALAQSEGDVQLIALWDRCAIEGLGGIGDFIKHVEQNSGQVDIIDTNNLC